LRPLRTAIRPSRNLAPSRARTKPLIDLRSIWRKSNDLQP
jgi:hypothetical protein